MKFKNAEELARAIQNSDVEVVDERAIAQQPPRTMQAWTAQAQTGSDLERKFETLWRQLGGPELTREYRFHPTRKFRFDFAHIPSKCAFEVDGGTWASGRSGHNWGTGIRADCIKRNEAALLGWRVFVFTADMLRGDEAAANIEPVIELVKGGGDG